VTRLGIVTGLGIEAACVTRAAAPLSEPERPLTFSAGGSALRARAGAEGLLAAGAGALVSFGIAGGLAPNLRPGAIVIADAVVAPDGRRIATDAAWRESLRRRAENGARVTVAPVIIAPVAGEDRVLDSPAAKRSRFEASGAVAVDMESHGVARAAAEAGVPFLVLRAVADPAERAIPSSALSALTPEGRLRVLKLAAALAARPWEIVALLVLARESRAALRALGRVAALDPARFALV
jgi:adenosylhomocysteine nucleosidase